MLLYFTSVQNKTDYYFAIKYVLPATAAFDMHTYIFSFVRKHHLIFTHYASEYYDYCLLFGK